LANSFAAPLEIKSFGGYPGQASRSVIFVLYASYIHTKLAQIGPITAGCAAMRGAGTDHRAFNAAALGEGNAR
jgi:lipid-binding SYLF domain-containing protein